MYFFNKKYNSKKFLTKNCSPFNQSQDFWCRVCGVSCSMHHNSTRCIPPRLLYKSHRSATFLLTRLWHVKLTTITLCYSWHLVVILLLTLLFHVVLLMKIHQLISRVLPILAVYHFNYWLTSRGVSRSATSSLVIGWNMSNFQSITFRIWIFYLNAKIMNNSEIFHEIATSEIFLPHCVDPKLWLGESWEFKKQKPVWSDNGMGHIPMLQSEYWIYT